MADVVQVNGARIHALITQDSRISVNGARIHALITQPDRVAIAGARTHALLVGPLSYTATISSAGGLTIPVAFGEPVFQAGASDFSLYDDAYLATKESGILAALVDDLLGRSRF